MGSCPCPRCLMPKASFDLLGLFKDTRYRITNLRNYCLVRVIKARELIYREGNTVDGSKAQATLGEGSWVPTVVSAFVVNLIRSVPNFRLELICRETRATGIRHISNARRRLYARMQARYMESVVYASYPSTIRASQRRPPGCIAR